MEYQSGENLDLRLYDISGRLLYTRKLNKSNTLQTIRLDLIPYREGILILHLVGENYQKVYRIVKN